MNAKMVVSLFLIAYIVAAPMSAMSSADHLRGTLVVAVPLQEGLLTCADKRLFNVEVGTYSDNNVKIRKVGNNAVFVATNTVGFYDRKNKKIVFDAFEVTANYTSRHPFSEGREFWDGLKNEIRERLRDYFAARDYSEWPDTDTANNNLLFNLIFYSVEGGRPRSHTLQVFYEKKRTPVVSVTGPLSEDVRSPKLTGKGRDLMAYISRNSSLASDPSILKFDGARFDIRKTPITDAVEFSRTLFRLTNTRLPEAQVSSTFDCALLSYEQGFRWIEGGSATSALINPLAK